MTDEQEMLEEVFSIVKETIFSRVKMTSRMKSSFKNGQFFKAASWASFSCRHTPLAPCSNAGELMSGDPNAHQHK